MRPATVIGFHRLPVLYDRQSPLSQLHSSKVTSKIFQCSFISYSLSVMSRPAFCSGWVRSLGTVLNRRPRERESRLFISLSLKEPAATVPLCYSSLSPTNGDKYQSSYACTIGKRFLSRFVLANSTVVIGRSVYMFCTVLISTLTTLLIYGFI